MFIFVAGNIPPELYRRQRSEPDFLSRFNVPVSGHVCHRT